MKAAVYHRFGPPEVVQLEDIPKPIPKDDEVLVRIRAAAVSPVDLFWLTGEPFIMRPGAGLVTPRNPVLGSVVAGQVETVGAGVTKYRSGDEVFAETSHGGFAEYTCVPEATLAVKPANLTFEQAAAVPLVGVTALQGLRDHGKVKPGQKVLINGASGGVGTFAVQIAKVLGAEVTGVCSTANVELVRSLGADHVIDYTREDFTKGAAKYDVVLDNVGNRSISECRQALTPRGTYLPSSAAGGRWIGGVARVVKSAALSPFVSHRLRPFLAVGKPEDLDYLRELIEAGEVTPVIDRAYPLSETAQALAHYGTGHAQGKVIVTM